MSSRTFTVSPSHRSVVSPLAIAGSVRLILVIIIFVRILGQPDIHAELVGGGQFAEYLDLLDFCLDLLLLLPVFLQIQRKDLVLGFAQPFGIRLDLVECRVMLQALVANPLMVLMS
jgi:hypothetical protein